MSKKESSATYMSQLRMEYFHTRLEILNEHTCMTVYYLFVSSADGVLPYLAENLNELRYLCNHTTIYDLSDSSVDAIYPMHG